MTKPTLKRGSKGEAVKEWQKIIGVEPDGDFGPKTETATKGWQFDNKLAPDGIVGALSWAAALGKPVSTESSSGASTMGNTPTASQSTDKWANDVALRAAPNMPAAERQYVLSVARGEGFYGKGWGSPSKATVELSAKYGLTGKEGVGSNNWGAVQGTGSAGSFQHVDHRADGTPYVHAYRSYKTPEEGFLDMARIILGGGKRKGVGAAAIKDALRRGSLKDAVYAQRENGYYELAPDKYLAAVKRNYGVLRTNLNWPELLTETGKTVGKFYLATMAISAVAAAGVGAYLWLASRKGSAKNHGDFDVA